MGAKARQSATSDPADRAIAYAKGGDGGNGLVGTRCEKHKLPVGLNGGNGGNGGLAAPAVDMNVISSSDHWPTLYCNVGDGMTGSGDAKDGLKGVDSTSLALSGIATPVVAGV